MQSLVAASAVIERTSPTWARTRLGPATKTRNMVAAIIPMLVQIDLMSGPG